MRSLIAIGMVLCSATSILLFGVQGVTAGVREKRVALVIGNSQYINTPALRNPINDAQDITEKLRTLHFEVQIALDLTGAGLKEIVRAFSERAKGADVALFFFAGHGIQIQDKNYILGVDANISTKAFIEQTTLPADEVIRLLELESRINLIFLDACRNNPLVESLSKDVRSSVRPGLAEMRRTFPDTLIAFSARAGDLAEDGQGRNSPYTIALTTHLGDEDVPITNMLILTNREVRASTEGRQSADFTTGMTRLFYFNPKNEETTPPTEFSNAEIIDKFDDWQVLCKKRADGKGKSCGAVQSVTATERKNISLTVYFQRFNNGVRTLRVFAPLGVLMPPGLGLKVDDKDVGHAPFIKCVRFGCYALVMVDDALFTKLRQGNTAIFVIFQTEESGFGIPISLSGFADAVRALERL